MYFIPSIVIRHEYGYLFYLAYLHFFVLVSILIVLILFFDLQSHLPCVTGSITCASFEGCFPSASCNRCSFPDDFNVTLRLFQGEFDVQSQLPNVVPDPASLELGSEYYCEPGKVVFGDQCGE